MGHRMGSHFVVVIRIVQLSDRDDVGKPVRSPTITCRRVCFEQLAYQIPSQMSIRWLPVVNVVELNPVLVNPDISVQCEF